MPQRGMALAHRRLFSALLLPAAFRSRGYLHCSLLHERINVKNVERRQTAPLRCVFLSVTNRAFLLDFFTFLPIYPALSTHFARFLAFNVS